MASSTRSPHTLSTHARFPGVLPAHVRPATRPHGLAHQVFDVTGGILFAVCVALVVITASWHLSFGYGWGAAIGWESVWLVAALLCRPLMPSGIVPSISLATTLEGVKLDWPELLVASYVLWGALQFGLPNGIVKPAAYALAVGSGEEFIFRVIVLGWLVTRMEPAKALLVSAVVFGCAHLQHPLEHPLLSLMNVVPQFAGGMVLGAIYLRTRNPLGNILCHAFWDFPYFLALGAGISGGGTEGGMPSAASIAFWMIFACYGLFLVRARQPLPGRDVPVAAQAPPTAFSFVR